MSNNLEFGPFPFGFSSPLKTEQVRSTPGGMIDLFPRLCEVTLTHPIRMGEVYTVVRSALSDPSIVTFILT